MSEYRLNLGAHLASSTPMVQNKKRSRVGSNTCPKCDSTINNEENCMQCCVCELNFCMNCTNISPALALALKEDTTQNFKWTCNVCKQNFPCMTGLAQQLTTIEEKTDKRLNKLEKQFENIDTNIDTKVKTEVKLMQSDIISQMKEEIKASLQDDVRKELYEIEDQRQRALNLIVFNIPESTSTIPNERKIHDKKIFIDLCSNIGVQPPDIKITFRLGNFKPQDTRPLKIILENKKQRKEILDNASKLKHLPNAHPLSRCIIVKDLTPSQRDLNKKRRGKSKKTKPSNTSSEHDAYNEMTICENRPIASGI